MLEKAALYDKSRMLEKILSFPRQCEDAFRIAGQLIPQRKTYRLRRQQGLFIGIIKTQHFMNEIRVSLNMRQIIQKHLAHTAAQMRGDVQHSASIRFHHFLYLSIDVKRTGYSKCTLPRIHNIFSIRHFMQMKNFFIGKSDSDSLTVKADPIKIAVHCLP